jgi:hypothetical protein
MATSTLTRSLLTAIVQYRYGQARAESAIPARPDDVELAIRKVREKIAELAVRDPAIRQSLTKDFSGTFTSAAQALTGAFAALHVGGLAKAKLLVAGYSEFADFYRDYADYLRGTPYPDIPRWTYYNGSIRVRSSNSALPVAARAFTIYDAIFEPDLDEPDSTDTTLPLDLEETFIDMVVAELLSQTGGPQPAQR